MKKSIMLLSVLWSLFFLFNEKLIAEDAVNLDYVIRKSPEVTGFERQGQYNASEYTGIVNINVPLYNLEYRDIVLPFFINYDSRGVKVDSEASWVGLNWDLNIGGCVSVIPNGGFDWRESEYREQYDGILNNKSYNDYCYDSGASSGIVTQYESGLTELDFYAVSLPNARLYFFIDPKTKQPTIIGPETGYFHIEADYAGTARQATNNIVGWKVIDGVGYLYEFNCAEKCNLRASEMYNSAWYLSNIISPSGNIMKFRYDIEKIRLIPQRSESEEILISVMASINGLTDYEFKQNETFSNETHYVEKPYLSSIETDEHQISFIKSTRSDIVGGKQLDSIEVKSKLTDDIVKRIKFNYGYFTSCTIGGNYLENRFKVPEECLSKRLKLKSVAFIAEGEEDQVYSFDYEENKEFPLKTSCAVDMWGYYNGKENKSTGKQKNTMIPCVRYCDIDPQIAKTAWGNPGANRFANPQKTDALILKQITYPTKGYTRFQYESNSYRKYFTNKLAAGNNVNRVY